MWLNWFIRVYFEKHRRKWNVLTEFTVDNGNVAWLTGVLNTSGKKHIFSHFLFKRRAAQVSIYSFSPQQRENVEDLWLTESDRHFHLLTWR